MQQLLLVGCAVAASHEPQSTTQEAPCNVSRPANEVCDLFCNYQCSFYNATAGETGRPTTLTLFRITERNVTGILDKNTGDLTGDLSFALEIARPTPGDQKDLLQSNTTLFGRFRVEVDGAWGPYLACNPLICDAVTGACEVDGRFEPAVNTTRGTGIWFDTRTFGCNNYFGPETINPTIGRKQLSANCSVGEDFACVCDTTHRERRAVGRQVQYQPLGPEALAVYPPGDPLARVPQCMRFVPGCLRTKMVKIPGFPAYEECAEFGGCISGRTIEEVQGWSADSAAALACEACTHHPNCTGWAVNAENWTATLFASPLVIDNHTSCVMGFIYPYVRDQWKQDVEHVSETFAAIDALPWDAVRMYGTEDSGGSWFSTTGRGQCVAGAPLGTDGCTWRVLAAPTYINAVCAYGRIRSAVERHAPECFAACPQPLDSASFCYMRCYVSAFAGNPGLNITRIDSSRVRDAFAGGFAADAGCEYVEPLPCVGAQCSPPPPRGHTSAGAPTLSQSSASAPFPVP
jgi:hypothetical protein